MVFTLHDLEVRGPIKPTRYRGAEDTTIPISRWFSLLAVVAAFGCFKIYGQLELGSSLETVLVQAGSSLTPVHSTFVAWNLILLVLLAYAVFQLFPEQRKLAAYDRVSRHVVLASLVATLILLTLRWEAIWLTAILTSGLAIVAGSAYQRMHREVSEHRAPAMLGIPFALLLGFSLVVAIAAADAAIVTAGCPSSAPPLLLLCGAGVGVVYLGLRFRDAALPGFVAWLATGICAASHNDTAISGIALLVGLLCVATAVLIAATRVHTRAEDLHRPQRAR